MPARPTALHLLVAACGMAALAGCANLQPDPTFNQMSLPDTLRVPAGHRVALETVGVGELTYTCQAKAGAAGQFEWMLAPQAALMDRAGKQVGKYYGPPATWEHMDGSKVTGAQVAVAPGGDGNLPLQLVKANPASGMGAMQNVSFIQRVATKGGLAPAATSCTSGNVGAVQKMKYQADYIFYKPA